MLVIRSLRSSNRSNREPRLAKLRDDLSSLLGELDDLTHRKQQYGTGHFLLVSETSRVM